MIAFALAVAGLAAAVGAGAALKSVVTTGSLSLVKQRFQRQGEEAAEAAKSGYFLDPEDDNLIEGSCGPHQLLLYKFEWHELLGSDVLTSDAVGAPKAVMADDERVDELVDIGMRRLAAKGVAGQ